MKIIALIVMSLLFLFDSANAQKTVETAKVPTTVQEFLIFRDQVAQTPEGGASVMLMALILYTQNEVLGKQAITIALDRSQLSQGDVYKGFQPPSSINFHLQNLKGKPYIARSYVVGTSPEGAYKLPGKIRFKLTQSAYNDQSNGDVKVFVQCSGADTPRPVSVRKNNRGVWKVVSYNSLFVGIRYPVQNVNDGL
jgi:hypothetical protein